MKFEHKLFLVFISCRVTEKESEPSVVNDME